LLPLPDEQRGRGEQEEEEKKKEEENKKEEETEEEKEEEKEEEEEEEEGRLRSPADLKCQLRWWPPQLRHVFAL
jgi:hypothetical protein